MFKLALICLLFVNAYAWGPYYIEGFTSPHNVVDAEGRSASSGTQLILYGANNQWNQKWCVNPDTSSNGTTYTIQLCDRPFALGNTYVEAGWVSSGGYYAQLKSMNRGARQVYTYTSRGQIRNSSGQCMDASGQGTSNGTDIIWYTCNNGNNQRWNFRSINSDGAKGGILPLRSSLSTARTNLTTAQHNAVIHAQQVEAARVAEVQRQAILTQQRAAQAEQQRQAELARQRAAEVERQRQAELARQRAAEAERQRQAELARQAAAEAERQRLAGLRAAAQQRFDAAMTAWNASRVAMLEDTTNDSDCGTVSEDYRCGGENGRCPWENCASSGWCGSGDLFTGNENFDAIEGCWTPTDIGIQREEWAAHNPHPVLENVTRRRRLMKVQRKD